jgi:hypothetical protein
MNRQLLVCSSLLFLFPSLLAAQHHAVMAAPPARPLARPVAAPTVAVSAAHRSPTPPIRSGAPPNRVRPTSSRPGRSQTQFRSQPQFSSDGFTDGFDDQSSDFPVPGLGFDAVHFAATHPNASHHRHNGSNFFVPLYGGDYYPYPVTNENPPQTAAQTAPQTSDDQNDYLPEDRQPIRRERPREVASAPTPPAEQKIEPPRESDQYIFVRRDGTLFFAVAYSWDHKTLRYINQQGLRQTLSSDALDLDATHQFNEQRGLSFRPPA